MGPIEKYVIPALIMFMAAISLFALYQVVTDERECRALGGHKVISGVCHKIEPIAWVKK